MSKSQEQFNSEYSNLCTKLGDAVSREQQAQADQHELKEEIKGLKYELAQAVKAAQEAQAEAILKAKADAAKDVTPAAEVQ